VLTVSWHDRSLCPERLWGTFYARLLTTLRESGAVFLTARQTASLFRARRAVRFVPDSARRVVRVVGGREAVDTGLLVRLVHVGGRVTETPCRRDQVIALPAREQLATRS
jgi:hypothetical protein